MSAVLKFILGVTATIMIGVAAMLMDELPWSAASVQRKIETRAAAALGDDAKWAQITVDGQKVIISGAAPSIAARDEIIARLEHADGLGGILIGGVTAIDPSGLTVMPVLPLADPFIWIAERESDALLLSGYAPSQIARDELIGLAQTLFPDNRLSAEIDVASGAPVDEAIWVEAAAASLRALSHVANGVAQANGKNFSVHGEALDETRANAARALMGDFPDGLIGEARIDVRPAPADINDLIAQADIEEQSQAETEADEKIVNEEFPPTPGLKEIALQNANLPENNCAEDLRRAIDQRRISFSSARADIDNASRAQLRDIATILNACPDIRLHITGHTDASGNAARNRQLSGYRADAVRAFLISVGSDESRLVASGVGSSRPLVSNATPDGRARNRRIEIEIITDAP